MAAKKTMRHASALKAKRQAEVRRVKNFAIRNQVRTLTANVKKAVEKKDKAKAQTALKQAQSAWQKAVKRGIFHKNVASRKISRLSKDVLSLAKA